MKNTKTQTPNLLTGDDARHSRRLTVRPDFSTGKFKRPLVCVARCGLNTALVLLLSTILYQPTTGSAQSYSIDWYKIAGGGGTSTGGVYSVSGTIGQHDAGGPMTNGQYSVTGGFWVLPTVIQTGGAPTLTIVPATPGNATISWTPNTPGWILQETWVLAPANWTNSPSGATNPIVVSATWPAKFYRLFKP